MKECGFVEALGGAGATQAKELGVEGGGVVDHRQGYSIGAPLRRAIRACADLIWPPTSLLSDRLVSASGAMEPDLWAELDFLGDPQCACCGFPFATPEGEGSLCGACLAEKPDVDAARSALAYGDHARTLVLALKRSGRRDGLPTFARWMTAAAGPLLQDVDLLAPVPLHWMRLAERRFNQSAWLAQAIGKVSGKPVDLFALQRVKRRRSQGGLTARGRHANVSGAFKARKDRVNGRVILLVDDVFTTGATLNACARALKRAGARAVYAVTLARVVRPVDLII